MKEQEESLQTTSQLLQLILQEQRQTNQLLLMLIEAMGEEDSGPDDEPVTYLDGSALD